MQTYMDTLHAIQRESILTTTLLQDVPKFIGHDSSKLADWFIDVETTVNILTESHMNLAQAKSCHLTLTLTCKATQAAKYWDEIKGILRLKLCNANIYTYTSHFMQIQQKDNETLTAYMQCFKTSAKQCAFDNDTAAICIFVKGLWDVHTTTNKIYERDPQTLAEVIRLVEKLNAAHQLASRQKPKGCIKARTMQPIKRFNKVECNPQQVTSLSLLLY